MMDHASAPFPRLSAHRLMYQSPRHGGDWPVVDVTTAEDGHGGYFVIMTEPPENMGVSVTNAAEHAVKAVSLLLFQMMGDDASVIVPDDLRWIEHYPNDGQTGQPSFDELSFSSGPPRIPTEAPSGVGWRRIFDNDELRILHDSAPTYQKKP